MASTAINNTQRAEIKNDTFLCKALCALWHFINLTSEKMVCACCVIAAAESKAFFA